MQGLNVAQTEIKDKVKIRARWKDGIAKKEGTTCNTKATDSRQWKALLEGYILQWMDKAQVKGEKIRASVKTVAKIRK